MPTCKLPIPGPSSVEHLKENVGALGAVLSDARFGSLAALATS
jgi:aryl-alcohol dehydrogenase-like predicted oxidoreductase